jgi:hypothetical protein
MVDQVLSPWQLLLGTLASSRRHSNAIPDSIFNTKQF